MNLWIEEMCVPEVRDLRLEWRTPSALPGLNQRSAEVQNEPRTWIMETQMKRTALALTHHAQTRILIVRGKKIILDSDLAELYGVTVKRLNEQIKRNQRRFPPDFVFRLSAAETTNLRSQIATSRTDHGGRRYLPYAFTEHGAIMAATVLNSKRAIQMSVFVVRAFVRIREILASNQEIASKLAELETRLEKHDAQIDDIVMAIRQLLSPPTSGRQKRRQIGFELPGAESRSRTAARAAAS